MGGYTPVKGDRVRVVLEGEVVSHHSHGPRVVISAEFDREHEVWYDRKGVTIEKIEPVFKPGDVVRGKHNGAVYAIAETGWLMLSTESGPYGKSFTPGNALAEFTSENFELVPLG